jgi:hypothetical protein
MPEWLIGRIITAACFHKLEILEHRFIGFQCHQNHHRILRTIYIY